MSINDKPTTDNVQGNDSVDELQVDEMTILKQRATMMGIKFSNNIGLEALRKRWQMHRKASLNKNNLK